MGIESTTSISGLDSTWPLGSDPIAQGDNHIRLLKSVLKTTFPGVGGNGFATPITAKEAEINYLVGVTSGIQAQINLKAPLANPTFTGVPLAPTAAVDTNTTQIATTAFVINQAYAKLNDPALTGNPTAPTPATNDNDTSIATTAFVQANFNSKVASQADMEAASSLTTFVSPGILKYHPFVPKILAKIGPNGNIIWQSGGIASVIDVGIGRITVNLSTPFASANSMVVQALGYDNSGASIIRGLVVYSYSTSHVSISSVGDGGSFVDPEEYFITIWGDL